LSDIDSPHRPDSACRLCPPPREGGSWRLADHGYLTCEHCYLRLRDVLKEIDERYQRLDPTPGASGENGGRGAPGFGSRSPASDHILCMTDRRSSPVARTWLGRDGRLHREAERPPLSVWGVLDGACWAIAEERGVDGPPPASTVYALTRFIDVQLDWVTRHLLVVDVWADLRALASQLRPVTGDQRARIGTCPNTLDEGEHSRECGAILHAPTRGDTISCAACSRKWPRSEWETLGRMIQAGTAA
jgi:hypothetical protein